MEANKTQRLPSFSGVEANRAALAVMLPRPRLRADRNTASMALTTELPVIGRAGTRERVLSGDAVFGGGEVR